MQTKFLLFLGLLFFAYSADAQLFLNLEKTGSPNGKRIYPGKVLVFKIEGDEMWRSSELIEIIPETNILVFEDQAHKVEDLKFLRDDSRSKWSGPLGTSLFTFGVSWSFYATGAHLFDDTYTYSKRDAILTGSTMLVGWSVRRLFRFKTIKLEKNYGLRIIDMRI